MDELELEALLLQNKIANVIQDEFAKEINLLVNEKARVCCDACRIDDPSHLHHKCLMTDEEELWICHYEAAHLNVDKLWSAIGEQIRAKLDVSLEDSWLKYSLKLFKVDYTTAFLLYKDFQRKNVKVTINV